MTKQEFLKELDYLLSQLPEPERMDILSDYESHIDSAIENGKTEKDAIADLGSPQTIADELGTMVPFTKKPNNSNQGQPNSNAKINIFAFLGMLLFNLIFILGPVAGIASVFIGLYVSSIACLVTPLGFIINLFTVDSPILLAFFFVLATFSFGYLLLLFTNFLAKGFCRILAWYWNLNVKIVKGGY